MGGANGLANEKNINSRIQHKHDIESNWLKAVTFVPKQGEIIIYDVDEIHFHERIKIGDGVQIVNDLPFYAGSWKDLEDKPDELEALLLLAEMEVVTPVVDANNYVYLDETDRILII